MEARARFFGLELEVWAGLLCLAGGLLALPWGLLAKTIFMIGLWAWMYFIDATKPPGYTRVLWQYSFSASILDVSLEVVNVAIEAIND